MTSTSTSATVTPAGTSHVILFVDDEQNILNSVQRILRRAPYRLLTANNPEKGLEIVKTHQISLVVSDFRMPGLNGVKLLEKVQKISPDTIRILLTGFADTESAIAAINSGQVFRYLKKPIRENELIEAIRSGIQQYELVLENRKLMEITRKQNEELKKFNEELEKKVRQRTQILERQKKELERLYRQLDSSFTETIHAFMSVIEMKNPKLGGHSRRVAALARRFAEYMKVSRNIVRQIEVAALLHDIGKITIPDAILEKPQNQLTEQEFALLKAHPEIGASILADIHSLQEVATIIEAHHERYNGQGYPKGLRGNDIPKGARILSVINAFDNLISKEQLDKKLRYELAINYLQSESGKHFDPLIVPVFLRFLKTSTRAPFHLNEKAVEISDLKPGMVLSRDVVTASGLLLLGKDQQLNSTKIRRLFQYQNIEPIAGPIYVYDS